jgi:hypothetical protein
MTTSMKLRQKRPVVNAKTHSLRMNALCTFYECQSAFTKPVVSAKVHSLQGWPKCIHYLEYLTKAKP